MPLDVVTAPFAPPGIATPASVMLAGLSDWATVIKLGGLIVQDPLGSGVGIVQNAALITDTTRIILRRSTVNGASGVGLGTALKLRLAFSVAIYTQTPILRVFGGRELTPTGDPDLTRMAALRNLEGDASVGFGADYTTASYVSLPGVSGQRLVTIPDNTAHAWDCDGCEFFVVAVERVLYGGPSNIAASAFLQAKIN